MNNTKNHSKRLAFLVIVVFGLTSRIILHNWPVSFPSYKTYSVTRLGSDVDWATSPLTKPDAEIQARVSENYGKLPLSFEVNVGQTDSQVKFLSRGYGYSLFLTASEAVLTLNKSLVQNIPNIFAPMDKHTPQSAVIRMRLKEANPNPEIAGVDELVSKTNCFIGDDSNTWKTNITNYERVQYRDVYPGIDVVYYGNQQLLEYDFVIAPNATPQEIKLSFEGAQKIGIDSDGSLVLHTSIGEIKQRKAYAYQDIQGKKKQVCANYKIVDNNQVTFEMGDYDAGRSLVIDPVLIYSTYLGGTDVRGGGSSVPGGALTQAYDIAVDQQGNAYITGATNSATFPVTAGVFQSTLSFVGQCSSCSDVFVAKLNPTGSSLVYSTYLGGSEDDVGLSIAVDSFDNAYVTGPTASNNFPITSGAFQTIPLDISNAFVTKLNSSGSALSFSTYLGSDPTRLEK